MANIAPRVVCLFVLSPGCMVILFLPLVSSSGLELWTLEGLRERVLMVPDWALGVGGR